MKDFHKKNLILPQFIVMKMQKNNKGNKKKMEPIEKRVYQATSNQAVEL